MSFDKSPDYPSPPDPWDTAAAQGTINQQTAYAQQRLNQTDQSTPYGTLRYVPTGENVTYNQFNQQLYDERLRHRQNSGMGGTPDSSAALFNTEVVLGPRYRAEVQLTPEGQAIQQGQMDLQQNLLDVGNDQLGRVSSALAQPLNLQGLPQAAGTVPDRIARYNTQTSIAPTGPIDQAAPTFTQQRATTGNAGRIRGRVGADDFGDDRQRVEDALMQRMQPYLDQRREQERTRLINQGFADPNSQGYSDAMDEVYRAENDARLGAILNAGQEQSRLFGMDLASGQFQNTAQQQAYGQLADRADQRNANIDANLRNQVVAQQAQNAAQQQRFEQAAQRAAFFNQTQAQNFAQQAAQNQAAFDAAAYQNALRDRAIQERMLLRQTPINEISALTSGAQVQLPQFTNTPQSSIQAPDYQGAVYANYQGEMANADRRAAQQNALTQGLFSLGGAGLGAFGAINPFGWG